MKELELRIAAFIANENVKTRSGVDFKVLTFQKDGNGQVTTLAGTVTEKRSIGTEGFKDELVPMLWTTNGNALCNQPGIYDLVEELPIEQLGK